MRACRGAGQRRLRVLDLADPADPGARQPRPGRHRAWPASRSSTGTAARTWPAAAGAPRVAARHGIRGGVLVIASDGWDSDPPESWAPRWPALPPGASGGLAQPPCRGAGVRAAGRLDGRGAAVLRPAAGRRHPDLGARGARGDRCRRVARPLSAGPTGAAWCRCRATCRRGRASAPTSFSAISRSAVPAGESGALSTIGTPSSPPSRTACSSGIWPSSGTLAPTALVSAVGDGLAAAGAEHLHPGAVGQLHPGHVLHDADDALAGLQRDRARPARRPRPRPAAGW